MKGKGHTMDQLFSNAYKEAVKLPDADIKKLLAAEFFKNLSSPPKYVTSSYSKREVLAISIITTMCAVASILLGIIFVYSLHTPRGLAVFWLTQVHNLSLSKEPCTWDKLDVVTDLFRPPVDCSMCHGVADIPRVSNLSPEMFNEHFGYGSQGHPIVVTDAMKNWTATQHFSFEFFQAIYTPLSDELQMLSSKDCQFFSYETEFKTLKEALSMPAERLSEAWYIGWSNCDSKTANTLRQHYQRPYFLPQDSESSKIDWIFMGTPGYGASLHIDHVEKKSWQAQVQGTKKWTLVVPPECYWQCDAEQMEVVVKPNEMIVFDSNVWYHRTEVIGDDLSIVIGSEFD